MAKALKIAAFVVGGVALAFTGIGLAAGLGAAATSFGIGVSASTLFLGAAALEVGASLLAKKGSTTSSQSDRLNTTIDPRAPRKSVYGHTAFANDLRYEEWFGDSQEYCAWIIALASHRITSLDEIWINQDQAWTAATGVAAKYQGYFYVQHIVTEGTPANTVAISSANKWNTSSRLTGCAYVHLQFRVTGTTSKATSPFSGGVPSRITLIGKGKPLYDPRRDSTVPTGNGTMRASDQSTWVYTEPDGADLGSNIPLQILSELLGWRITNPSNGSLKLAVGGGLPPRRIDMQSFIVAANIADEQAAISAGGTEGKFHGGACLSEGDDLHARLDMLCAACNGRLRDVNGKLSLVIMHNDLAAAASDDGLNDDDVIGAFTWESDPPLDQAINVVRGRYTDPSAASLFQMIDYPEVRLDSPDGIDRIMTLDLSVAQSASMAQRIAKQVLERRQYQRTFSAPFDIRAWKYQVGDVVPLTFSALSFDRRLLRVASQELGQDGQCVMSLMDENPAIYAWDASDAAPVVAAAPIVYDPTKSPLILGIAEAATSASWANVSSRPANLSTLTGSEGINNLGVSISANGALAGGGGGQVTIGGLGFAGSLNATRNADGANMIPSPVQLDEVSLGSGAILSITADTSRPAATRRMQLLPGVNSLGRWCAMVPCVPGDVLFYSYVVLTDGGASDTCNASVAYFRSDGTPLTAVNLSAQTAIDGFSASNVWVPRSASFIVPAGAAFVQPYVERPTSVVKTISFFVGEPYLGRAQQGATLGASWSGNLTNRPANLSALTGGEGINNLGISIGANGALLGGSGGQVTIGGLGYAGSLKATRNADGGNMIPSPFLLDEMIVGNGAIGSATADTTRPATYRRAQLLPSDSAFATWSGALLCLPGDVLFYSYVVLTDGGSSDTCSGGMIFYKADGTQLSSVDLAAQNGIDGYGANGVGWLPRTSVVTVPSGASFVQPYVMRHGAAGTSMSFFVSEPYLGRHQQGATLGASWSGNLTNRPANLSALTGGEGINNLGVSIGANGALAGGGGGQVTIGGLGYSGSLKATRNADGGNMIPSPFLLDEITLSANALLSVTSDTSRPATYRRAQLLPADGCNVRWSSALICLPGETLYYSYVVLTDGGSNDFCAGGMIFYRPDGTPLATTSLYSQTAISGFAANGVGWVSRLATVTVPAGAAFVQPIVTRYGAAGTSMSFFVGEPYLGRHQQGADVTATSTVQISDPQPSRDIAADYTGAIAANVLPLTLPALKITRGGTDISQADTTTYTLQNLLGGCAGNVTIDTTPGSSTKGQPTIGAGFSSNGSFEILVTVNGVAQTPAKRVITRVNGAPPASSGGSSSGSGGSGGTGGTFSSAGFSATNSTFAVVGTVTGIALPSGKALNGYFSDSYDISYSGTGKTQQNAAMLGKWQYTTSGGSSWTDFGSAVTGTSASYTPTSGDGSSGSLTANQSASPPAGTYDVRFVAAVSAAAANRSVYFDGSNQTVTVA